MVTKKKASAKSKKTVATKAPKQELKPEIPAATSDIPEPVRAFLKATSISKGFVNAKEISLTELRKRVTESNIRPTVPLEQLLAAVNRIKPADIPVGKLPEDVKESIPALKPGIRRFHGIKIPLYWFPFPWLSSACADKHVFRGDANGNEAAIQCRVAGAPGPARQHDGRPRPRSQYHVQQSG
jgi:hypothetical protein